MTQYSNNLAIKVLNSALDIPDNDIVAETAKKALPVIKQSYNMYQLLIELDGKFNDKDNTYNQQISDILRYIQEDKEKLENE